MAIRGAIDKMRENRGWHTEIPTDPFFREETLLFPFNQKKNQPQKKNKNTLTAYVVCFYFGIMARSFFREWSVYTRM